MLQGLLDDLRRIVELRLPLEPTVERIRARLSLALVQPDWLPSSCQAPAVGCYARHLIFRDPEDRLSVVAMVWSSGQKTPVHDHSGVWCVEGVYAGRIRITRYDLKGAVQDGLADFRRHDTIDEGMGSTGALIPPLEYHTIENPHAADAVTVHVYGKDMKSCQIFQPREDGLYEARLKPLQYHSVLAGA